MPAIAVIAHRGASSYAPENTIPAFDLALEMGADGLETDIRATKDGILVLLHDHTLDRTTDGRGPVSERTWVEVRQLDAGSWFAPAFAGTRIPTLDEFLAHYGRRTFLALEIKAAGIEAAVARALEAYRAEKSITVTSFNWDTLVALKKLQPSLRVGWLTRQFDEEVIEQISSIGGVQICPPASQITPQLVAFAGAKGLEVRAWGVSDEAAMSRAVEAGVDGMTVNFPDKLIAYLRAHGNAPMKGAATSYRTGT